MNKLSSNMRCRQSARLLIKNNNSQILLFYFNHKKGALAGKNYWATPGGGLEEGETFEQAAVRELREETGIQVRNVGQSIYKSNFIMELPNGEFVCAEEQFFLINVNNDKLSFNRWTPLEIETITEYRYWSYQDLLQTTEIIFLDNLLSILLLAA